MAPRADSINVANTQTDSINVINKHDYLADTLIYGVKYFKDNIRLTSETSTDVRVYLNNSLYLNYPKNSNTDGSVFTCRNMKTGEIYLECNNLNSAKINLYNEHYTVNITGISTGNTILANNNNNKDCIIFGPTTSNNLVECNKKDKTYFSYWGINKDTYNVDSFSFEVKDKETLDQNQIIDETLNPVERQYHLFTLDNNRK